MPDFSFFRFTVPSSTVDKFILEPHGIGIECKLGDLVELRAKIGTTSPIFSARLEASNFIVTCEWDEAWVDLSVNGKLVF